MPEGTEIDLSRVPISALRDRSRKQLEILNELRVIPTDETNIPRDWRGFAHFAGVKPSLLAPENRVSDILRLWDEDRLSKGENRPSIEELRNILVQLDRWDVYDDTEEMMLRDAEQYNTSLQVQPSAQETIKPFERGCLTLGDVDRLQQGLPLLMYDAFLLFADEDKRYASVMIDKLETDYNLRLIVKDRDLLSGVGFEFQAITKLIAERCASLIAILSPNFLQSDANMFFLAFAQSLSISQGMKRIIPCKYEPCELPPEISYLYYLDYQRALPYGNFWERIKNSVKAALPQPKASAAPTISGRCTVQEIQTGEIQSVADLTTSKHSESEKINQEQTAVVLMSDPSTHYPGNSLEDPENKWLVNKSPDLIGENIPQSIKGNGTGFLHSLRKKKKWFKLSKKKAVALEA